MDQPHGGFMARHTTMSPRIQKTPHGDVTLTSRWMRDHYVLSASGSTQALRWLFKAKNAEGKLDLELRGATARHVFLPSPKKITIERELRSVCTRWQDHWDAELADHLESPGGSTTSPEKLDISTLGDLFKHVAQQRIKLVSAGTVEKDANNAKLLLRELGAATTLESITEDMLNALVVKWKRTYAPQSINTYLGTLKTYLRWAFTKKLMSHEPHRGVKQVRVPNTHGKRRWWTPEDIEIALRCAKTGKNATTAVLLVAVGCLAGLRPEEIIMQRWQDIDLDACDPATGNPRPVLHVVEHDGWVPKDGEARTVPVSGRLAEILKPFRRSSGYLLKTKPRRLNVKSKNSYRYDPRVLWERLMEKAVAAGIKAITPNGMRHSFASNLLIANVSDVKVSRWLGHADTRMVHQHYGHLLSYDGDIDRVRYPTAANDASSSENPR